MRSIAKVEKEAIPSISFYQDEVCEAQESKVKRLKALKRATIIGNGQRRTVKVVFKRASGEVNEVETTIWAVGDHFVSLMAGITIPINSILSVDFF